MDLAGTHITDFLMSLLTERGYSAERKMVRDMKENMCYVGIEGTSEHNNEEYELPGGHIITAGSELFRAPEAMFQPHLIGLESPGIHELVTSTIMQSSDADVRQELFKNIVLSGGSTMLKGLHQRLWSELGALTNEQISIVANENRKYMAWVGGTVISSLDGWTADNFITRDEFDEYGSSIVDRKCPK